MHIQKKLISKAIHKMKAGLYLVAFVVITIGCVEATSPEIHTQLLKDGFKGSGIFTPVNSTERKPLSLYLSANRETHAGAMAGCKKYQGDLVYILNNDQDLQVRDFLYAMNEFEEIWTSGVFDRFADNWYWLSIDVLAPYNNLAAPCNRDNGYGIYTLLGFSNYKWCSSRVSTAYKYVCII